MRSAFAFAMAWLAAWCQVVLVVTMSWGALAAGLGALDGTPICHADAEQGQPQPAQPAHGAHDCVLCAVCQSHGAFVVVPASAATPRSRNAVALTHFVVAQPRAPPLRQPIAAQPRGPPSLI
jgi:hypothetical protein